MPLNRYQLRNEYSLADPELYRVADKDDPEALLEGVAMAGLIGLLRQLGDLAEFAAEIFHELHEEVVATAARGHGLTIRVQQLEADFPSMEMKLLSQTNHTTPLYSSGIDWHPNLRVDQNLITRGDLPRLVMDSYEECRGPPRLFLLDKYDVAGAGACLKRYTDPSFFKGDCDPSVITKSDFPREKRIRKAKKTGPRWKNGEIPESFTASHAKLHQLLLVDHFENGRNDPDRRVKLKKRQFSGSICDEKARKAYMEKFLKTCSGEHKFVPEISADPSSMNLMPYNTSQSGPEIVEIGTVSPARESKHAEERIPFSPPDVEEVVKSSVNESSEVIDDNTRGLSLPKYRSDTDKISLTFSERRSVKDAAVYPESKSEGSEDEYNLDDSPSEMDSYMDALATMESEIETESGYRVSRNLKYVTRTVVDCDANVGHDLPKFSLDSRSGRSSNRSDSVNSSFNGRESLLCSDDVSNITKASTDGDRAAAAIDSTGASADDLVQTPLNHLSASGDTPNHIPGFAEAACSSCFSNLNTIVHSSEMVASLDENSVIQPQLDEKSSESKLDRLLIDTDERWKVLGAKGSCKGTLSDSSLVRDDSVISAERPPGDELTYEKYDVSCRAVSDASEDKFSPRSFGEALQLEAADDLAGGTISSFHSISSTEDDWTYSSGQHEVVACSNVVSLLNISSVANQSYLDIANPTNLAPEDHCGSATEENLENLPLLKPAHSPGLLEQHLSEITDVDPSPDLNLQQEAAQLWPDNLNHMGTPTGPEVEEIKPGFGTLSDVALSLDNSPSSIHVLSEILYPADLDPEEDNSVPSTEKNSQNFSHFLSSGDSSTQQHLSEKIDAVVSPEHDLQEEDVPVYPDAQTDRGAHTASRVEEIEASKLPENQDIKPRIVACSDFASILDNSPIIFHSLPRLTGDDDLAPEEFQCILPTDENAEYLPLLSDPAQSSSKLQQDVLETDADVSGQDNFPKEGVHVYQDKLSCIRTSTATENESSKAPVIHVNPSETNTALPAPAKNDVMPKLLSDRQEPGTVEIIFSDDSISYSIDVPSVIQPSSTTTLNFDMPPVNASQTNSILKLLPSETANVPLFLEPGQSKAIAEPVQSEVNGARSDNKSDTIMDEATFHDALHVHLLSKDLDSSNFKLSCENSAFLADAVTVSSHVHSVTACDREADVEVGLHENLLRMSTTVDTMLFNLETLQEESPPAKEYSRLKNLDVAESASDRDGESDVLDDVNGVPDVFVNTELNPSDGPTTESPNLKLLDEGPDSLAEGDRTNADFIQVAEAPLSSKKCVKEFKVSPHNETHLPEGIALSHNSIEKKSETHLPEGTALSHNSIEMKSEFGKEIEHQDRSTEVELLHAVEVTSKSVDGEQIHGAQHIEKEILVDTASGSCSALPLGQLSVLELLQSSGEHILGNVQAVASSASVAPQVGTVVDEGHSSEKLDDRTQTMDPLSCGFSFLPILPNTAEISMEEMPPLPPLPPMQWRLGRLQHASLPVERPVQYDVHSEILSKASKPETVDYVDQFLLPSNIEDAKMQNLSDSNGLSIDYEDYQHSGSLLSSTSATFLSPQNGLQASETDTYHPSTNHWDHEQPVGSLTKNYFSGSMDGGKIKDQLTVIDERLQHISSVREEESTTSSMGLGSSPPMYCEQQLPQGLMTPGGVTAWLSNMSSLNPPSEEENAYGTLKKKLPRPRNPLIDAVVALDKSKLRKVGERVKSYTEQKVGERETVLDMLQLRKVGERAKPQVEQKVEEREMLIDVLQLRKVGERAKSPVPMEEDRDALLQQIRNKSFHLKPAAVTRPSIQGPKTNLKVAAILEKANTIRQAMAGSDEDDSDGWSDS
ncbi:hypothetical protein Dimus_006932 [Dionaea muscipula]